ncbi:hypothetical protein D3C71_1029900 [compost metagenome]
MFLLRLKNHDACRFSLEHVQLFPLFALPLMDTDGYPAVDLCTRYLLQDRSPIIRCRLEERGKAALGQQHGASETVKVHAGSRLDLVGYTSDLGFENLPRISIGNLMLRWLEFAIRLLACPVLTPVTAVTPSLGFEGHLGEAFAGLAGHDFVSALGDLVQARRPPIKGEANSIEDRGLPRAGGAGDGKDAIRREGRVHQVDLPFADQ